MNKFHSVRRTMKKFHSLMNDDDVPFYEENDEKVPLSVRRTMNKFHSVRRTMKKFHCLSGER